MAWWLMPRTPDPEVGGSSPTWVKPCFVLEQGTFTPQKVLVIPRKRWLLPSLTKKLFTGTLRINQPTNILKSLCLSVLSLVKGLKLCRNGMFRVCLEMLLMVHIYNCHAGVILHLHCYSASVGNEGPTNHCSWCCAVWQPKKAAPYIVHSAVYIFLFGPLRYGNILRNQKILVV